MLFGNNCLQINSTKYIVSFLAAYAFLKVIIYVFSLLPISNSRVNVLQLVLNVAVMNSTNFQYKNEHHQNKE